jgi:hypothetical protein
MTYNDNPKREAEAVRIRSADASQVRITSATAGAATGWHLAPREPSRITSGEDRNTNMITTPITTYALFSNVS